MKSTCKRCGVTFDAGDEQPMSRCCEFCKVRNFLDNCDLPTPPELIDRHTKHPALTPEGFQKQLSNLGHREPDNFLKCFIWKLKFSIRFVSIVGCLPWRAWECAGAWLESMEGDTSEDWKECVDCEVDEWRNNL